MPTDTPSAPLDDKFTLREYRKLMKAADLIADVQVPRAKANDDMWQELFNIRTALGREIYKRRPENWTKE